MTMTNTAEIIKQVQRILARPSLPMDTLRLEKLLGPVVNEANAAEEQREIARQWMERAYKLGYKDK